MELNELVKNEYYIVKYTDEYVMQYDGKLDGFSAYIKIKENYFNIRGNFRFNQDCKLIRKASNKEINWLKKCIEIERFISFSEIKEEPIDILSKLELW
jgi:hypothetical protein